MRNTFVVFFFLSLASFCSIASSQSVVNGSDVRILTEDSGVRDRNNGGNSVTGRLIGVNTSGIDNFMVFDFLDFSEIENQTVTGASVTFYPAGGFGSAQHGSASDLIVLNEMALPNAGWFGGRNAITGSDNGTDDGSISFANRVEYVDGSVNGTPEPWLGEDDLPVDNILGTLNELDATFGWDAGDAPDSFVFSIEQFTAQSWVDDGLAGLVLSVIDDGDSRSRFNLAPIGQTVAQIDFSIDDTPRVLCDFNDNLTCDVEDINNIVEAVVAGSTPSSLDLNGDSNVDLDDITQWLSLAATQNGLGGPYLMGDANLDGTVDAIDLNQLGLNWQASPDSWIGGDFNGTGNVDSQDLNVVGVNWLQSIPATAEVNAVPEPGSQLLFLIGFAIVLKRFRFRRQMTTAWGQKLERRMVTLEKGD